MFEIEINGEFCAAHSLIIAGEREPVHGHNWRVTVVVAGPRLDADGLLCDFHALERSLREILGPLNNRSLNEVAPFDEINPSAEEVARYIGEGMAKKLVGALPAGAWVASARVTEAPGCAATYRRGGP